MDLRHLEDQTLIDKGAILKAILAAEFYEDTFYLQQLSRDHALSDRMGDVAMMLDSWYSEHVVKIREIFESLLGYRPMKITDVEFKYPLVLIELCEEYGEVTDDEDQ